MACIQNCTNLGLQGDALTRCIASCSNQNILIPSIPTFQSSSFGGGIDPSLLSMLQRRRFNQSIDPEELSDIICNSNSRHYRHSRYSRYPRHSRYPRR